MPITCEFSGVDHRCRGSGVATDKCFWDRDRDSIIWGIFDIFGSAPRNMRICRTPGPGECCISLGAMWRTQGTLPAAVYWRRRILAGAVIAVLPFSCWAVVTAATGEPALVSHPIADTGGSAARIAGGMVPVLAPVDRDPVGNRPADSGPTDASPVENAPDQAGAGADGAAPAHRSGSDSVGPAEHPVATDAVTPHPEAGAPDAGRSAVRGHERGPVSGEAGIGGAAGSGDDSEPAEHPEGTPHEGPAAAADGDHARSAPAESVFRRWWRTLRDWWTQR